MTTASLKRWHEAGKHTDEAKDGCPLCEAGAPNDAGPGVEVSDEPAAHALLEQFRDCFDEVFERMDRLDGYRFLLEQGDAVAEGNPSLDKDVRGLLRNEVLANALAYYLPDVVQPSQFAACFRGAQALSSEDGHYWWILAAQATASAELKHPARVVGYLTQVAAGKRETWLEELA